MRHVGFVTYRVLLAGHALLLGSAAVAQTTIRVSVGLGGTEANGKSLWPELSADGRFVAFMSEASNLVSGDTNGWSDVFVRDRQTGTTERVSVSSSGEQGDNASLIPSISADGRYVTFMSLATNLVTGDTNAQSDVFIRDRQLGTTERVSVGVGGLQGSDYSGQNAISGDGHVVVFKGAWDLIPGGTFGSQLFVPDPTSGGLAVVSVNSSGTEGNYESVHPSLSGDGRYVVFLSLASNFVPGDTNGTYDTFVHDRQNGTTQRVDVSSSGVQADFGSYFNPSISADGRFIVFSSGATNLVPGSNQYFHIYLRDLLLGLTTQLSVDANGVVGNNESYECRISADGRFVAFHTAATNLFAGDTNGFHDVVVLDRQTGVILPVSLSSSGAQSNGPSYGWPSISADGRYVAFESHATNLVAGDTNGVEDIFVADRQGIPFVADPICFGDGTQGPCPCGNTGQPSHGCENSASTGGGLVIGSGEPLLSADTFVLTSSNERPTSLSLFWQGGTEVAPRVFGDGLGCMGPPLKRMYSHNAVGGSATAPTGAELSLSARSAALGDPISPGTIRIYHVFYRDGIVTYCPWPFGSTFNTTNGLRVLWGG